MSSDRSVGRTRTRWRVTGALVILLLAAGCGGQPAAGPPAATGERLDTRFAIPLGLMYENEDGPGGAGGTVPRCLGRPVAHYGISRMVDDRVDFPRVLHQLFVYSDVATAMQVFTDAVADVDELIACNGQPGAKPLSVAHPRFGAEAIMVTVPLPLDGAGEHAGEPHPILLF